MGIFMKLFRSLLIAPATLGLLAPLSATANELNLNDVSGYSSSEEIENISEFNTELAVTNSRVDGLDVKKFKTLVNSIKKILQ